VKNIKSRLNKKPRAIIFDWDNTLVDSWMVIADALNFTLKSFNYEQWSLQKVKKNVKHSLRDSFPALFGSQWQDAAELFYDRYGSMHTKLIKPIRNTKNMLIQLKRLNIYLAIVSNKRGDYLRKEAQQLRWDSYFVNIIGANDTESDKPSIAPVNIALGKKIDPKKENVWFVGDTEVDMECGWNANCVPILIRKNLILHNEFIFWPPAIHFRNSENLCKWVRKLYR